MPRATKSTAASRQAVADSTDPTDGSTSTAPARKATTKKASAAKKEASKKVPAAKKAAVKKAAVKKAPAPMAPATGQAASNEAPAPEAATQKAATQKAATQKAPARTATAKRSATTEDASGAGAEQAPSFDAAFLESQRALLLEEREAHTRQAAGLRAEAEQLAEERDPGDVQFDEESGQGDTMNVERERDLALSAQAMQQVQEIDTALIKLDKGTYGLCERCGRPIPEERLAALPWASLDVGCKSMGFARR